MALATYAIRREGHIRRRMCLFPKVTRRLNRIEWELRIEITNFLSPPPPLILRKGP